MTIYFQHLEGSKKGQVESLDSDRIHVGRQPGSDLRFDPNKDREVSGSHAEIYRQGDIYFIQDLQSRNGTYVNSRRINQPTPLGDGDVIEFSSRGPKVVFCTREPSVGTIVVKEEQIARSGVGSKTVAMMIGDALAEAKAGQRGRFGSTTVFMRELLSQARTHSSRRLRLAVICLVILLFEITGGFIYINYQKRQELGRLAAEQEKLLKEQREQQAKIAEQQAKLGEMEALINALKAGGIDAKRTPRGVSVNLPNVLFEFDSAELTAEGRDKVTYIASALGNHGIGTRLFVEGHASQEAGGSQEYNQRLSENRAQMVANALATRGISNDRIAAKGFGTSRPEASNDTEEGRRQNRRVEVIVEH